MSEYYNNKFRIESTRFKGWDYADFGCYYITIVTHNRMNYFGKIENNKMIYNDIGDIVKKEYVKPEFDVIDFNSEEFIMNEVVTPSWSIDEDEDLA